MEPHTDATPTRADRRTAAFYFCPDYHGKGPRVVLLVGAWAAKMREHHGIRGEAFASRPAHPSEPSTYPNGFPWGWVFTAENAAKYERHFRPEAEIPAFERALAQEIATEAARVSAAGATQPSAAEATLEPA